MSVLYIPECGKACFTIRKAQSGHMKDTLSCHRKAFSAIRKSLSGQTNTTVCEGQDSKTADRQTHAQTSENPRISIRKSLRAEKPSYYEVGKYIHAARNTHLCIFMQHDDVVTHTPVWHSFYPYSAPPPGRQLSLYIQTFALSAYLPEIHSALIGEFLHAPC